jgi:hypothetical protein
MNKQSIIKNISKINSNESCIYSNLSFINGNIFYAYEYHKYLNIPLIINISSPFNLSANKIINLWKDKYSKIDLNEIFFMKNKKIISKNILILDYSSFKDLDKIFFAKKVFYNYGDDERSLLEPLNNRKIITFGDKEINCKVQYHFPLKINFSLFKPLFKPLFKKIKGFQKRTFIEDKMDDDQSRIFQRKRNIKNFHESFNKLIYKKKGCWERANRLIPECKFYNKEIIYENYDNFIDSSNLRFQKNWQDYDLGKDKEFKEWIKDNYEK